jgi:hypothetical protein
MSPLASVTGGCSDEGSLRACRTPLTADPPSIFQASPRRRRHQHHWEDRSLPPECRGGSRPETCVASCAEGWEVALGTGTAGHQTKRPAVPHMRPPAALEGSTVIFVVAITAVAHPYTRNAASAARSPHKRRLPSADGCGRKGGERGLWSHMTSWKRRSGTGKRKRGREATIRPCFSIGSHGGTSIIDGHARGTSKENHFPG